MLNLPGPRLEKIKKVLSKLFHGMGLQATIEANLKNTDFLDVHLNLANSSYKPFKKPNHELSYVLVDSNHPKCISKQIPYMIQQRISNLSKTADIFYNEIQPFADALVRAGHKQILNYKSKENTSKKKHTRRRNVIWFNPPFNKSTNLAAKFLLLINLKHYTHF